VKAYSNPCAISRREIVGANVKKEWRNYEWGVDKIRLSGGEKGGLKGRRILSRVHKPEAISLCIRFMSRTKTKKEMDEDRAE